MSGWRQVSLPAIHYCNSAYAAAEDVDALVIATEWQEFRALDLARLKRAMAQPLIVDLRNIYDMEQMNRAAIRYVALGRTGRAASPIQMRRRRAAAMSA